MAHYSSVPKHLRATSRRRPPTARLPAAAEEQQERHTSHRTKRLKIRGLVLDPPGIDGPIEVCVNHQADWDLIYKIPAIRVKCLVESCDTLLTAKRMNRSRLRFLAVRSGGCSHNLVEMRMGRDEVEPDPSKPANGGGPEGQEHLWIKGRLFKIAQQLGAKPVVEHSATRADVYLPKSKLALEYQRWDTDFRGRTAQRSSAGAARTVWMFPWQPPNAPRTQTLIEFNREVFEHGGIYVAVRDKDHRELQRPWDDPSQERTARLYASGSIAMFDHNLGALVRKELSLATVLSQIISGDRVLARARVLTKSSGHEADAWVWALHEDLAFAEAGRAGRRRAATPVRHIKTTPALQQPTTPESRPESKLPVEKVATEGHGPARPPMSPPSTARRPWWKSIAGWFRRV